MFQHAQHWKLKTVVFYTSPQVWNLSSYRLQKNETGMDKPVNATETIQQIQILNNIRIMLFSASHNTFIELLTTWLEEALRLSICSKDVITAATTAWFNRGRAPGVRYTQAASVWPHSVTELSRRPDLCCNAICFRSACALLQINLTVWQTGGSAAE